MSDVDNEDDPLTRTQVLRKEFGRAWRFWHWLAKQFSGTSLGVIGVILASASTYIVHLNGKVTSQQTQITVLETKVLPVLQEGERAAAKLDRSTEKISEMREQMASMLTNANNHETRLLRIESHLDLDYLDEQKRRADQHAQRKHK